MAYDVEPFRARYRAGIHPRYNAWLHGGFVFGFGLLAIAFFLRQLQGVQPLEWLTIPAALVFFNWGEYSVHLHLGHHKHALSALFYKRHTGDHHSFFVENRMRYEGSRDWRVILFPAWLILVFSFLLAAPAFWLISQFNVNVAALFAATLLSGYLAYEFFHACEHLPPEHPLARLPWIRHMRQLHRLHHRREIMQTRNFNITFPLMDWLYGTLHWETPGNEDEPAR
jgi:hypothetical protein